MSDLTFAVAQNSGILLMVPFSNCLPLSVRNNASWVLEHEYGSRSRCWGLMVRCIDRCCAGHWILFCVVIIFHDDRFQWPWMLSVLHFQGCYKVVVKRRNSQMGWVACKGPSPGGLLPFWRVRFHLSLRYHQGAPSPSFPTAVCATHQSCIVCVLETTRRRCWNWPSWWTLWSVCPESTMDFGHVERPQQI